MKKRFLHRGFTLIEVLIALAIVSIALAALLKATSTGVRHTEQIKDRTIAHLIQMQAIAAIQLGLEPVNNQQNVTKVTTMFGQQWYWKAVLKPTPIKNTDLLTISISKKSSGPFIDDLSAFRYKDEK